MILKNIIRKVLILATFILIVIFVFQVKTFKSKYLLYKTKKEGYKVKKYFVNIEKNTYFILLVESLKEKSNFSPDKLIVYKNSLFNIPKIGTIEDGRIEFHKFNFKDINHDGIKDIIVFTASGGNCFCCEKIEIYNIKDDRLIKAFKNRFGCINNIIDLDNDGIYEIILFDDRFEFLDDLCRACSPSVEYVYQWKGKKYINTSVQFPNFYDKTIGNLTEDVKSDYNSRTYLDDDYQGYYLGKVITLLLNYDAKGEREKGIMTYKKYAQPEFFRDEIKITSMKIFDNPEDFLNKYNVW